MRFDVDLPNPAHQPPVSSRALDAIRPRAEVVIRRLWKVREWNRENVPSGPCLLAINHLSNLDGPLVVGIVPNTMALAKKELFRGPLGATLRLVGQIPIDRWHPDATAMKRAIEVLRSGRKAAIFPEMHRGPGTFERFEAGVAYLALVTGAPVLPVAVFGTLGAKGGLPAPGSPLNVVYGESIAVSAIPWPRTPGKVAALATELHAACQAHVLAAQELTGASLPGQRKI